MGCVIKLYGTRCGQPINPENNTHANSHQYLRFSKLDAPK